MAERPSPSSDAVRRRFESQARRDTRPEIELRRALHARGLRYRVDARPLAELNRKADLVFRRQRVAVFVDGCFWHRCPDHFVMPKNNRDWWEAKILRNVERDRETTMALKAAGWTVVRIWEHTDSNTAAAEVVAVLRVPD